MKRETFLLLPPMCPSWKGGGEKEERFFCQFGLKQTWGRADRGDQEQDEEEEEEGSWFNRCGFHRGAADSNELVSTSLASSGEGAKEEEQ